MDNGVESRRTGTIGALILAVVVAGSLAPTNAAPEPGDESLKGWNSLTLAASKAVIFSAKAVIEVSEAPYAGNGKTAIAFKTRSEARILGASGFKEETISWIDRTDHHPIEFFQMRPGESARRFVFLDGAVRQTSWEPPPSRPDSVFADWHEMETVERKVTYSDGTAPKQGEAITDFYSLIYQLRDLDLDEQQAPREFNTLYRRHVIRLRVIPGEQRRNQREILNETSGKTETFKLRERRIVIKPLGPGAESFRGMMGMQGDTEIWIDQASGALVEIDGNAPGLGATQVLLTSFRR
ncbi:MAG TPA: hypothetical protein VFE84_13715 [Patescibacteria group bacterium]|jgi:hypothetical protein|nr:hypothetical protein [Patescibacteria group bacterium]